MIRTLSALLLLLVIAGNATAQSRIDLIFLELGIVDEDYKILDTDLFNRIVERLNIRTKEVMLRGSTTQEIQPVEFSLTPATGIVMVFKILSKDENKNSQVQSEAFQNFMVNHLCSEAIAQTSTFRKLGWSMRLRLVDSNNQAAFEKQLKLADCPRTIPY